MSAKPGPVPRTKPREIFVLSSDPPPASNQMALFPIHFRRRRCFLAQFLSRTDNAQVILVAEPGAVK